MDVSATVSEIEVAGIRVANNSEIYISEEGTSREKSDSEISRVLLTILDMCAVSSRSDATSATGLSNKCLPRGGIPSVLSKASQSKFGT